MKPALHLHIHALSLPGYDTAQRNAFLAALVRELIQHAAANGGVAGEAHATQLRATADSARPGEAGAQAGRLLAHTVRGRT